MTVIDTMTAWGIVNPDAVSEIAARTGLPLALACALLDQESGGGQNIWGHDAVATGGMYTKGAPVGVTSYKNYRALADIGSIGRQGVGPCQLTSKEWQDAADARGGCWDPSANMLAAFSGLVTMVNKYGLPDGVRRYNGSGPAAEAYRDQVLTRYRAWTDRLGTQGDDVALSDDDVQRIAKAVMDFPLPDLYPATAQPAEAVTRDLRVGDLLAWAAANAGRALAEIKRLPRP